MIYDKNHTEKVYHPCTLFRGPVTDNLSSTLHHTPVKMSCCCSGHLTFAKLWSWHIRCKNVLLLFRTFDICQTLVMAHSRLISHMPTYFGKYNHQHGSLLEHVPCSEFCTLNEQHRITTVSSLFNGYYEAQRLRCLSHYIKFAQKSHDLFVAIKTTLLLGSRNKTSLDATFT